MNIKLEFLTEPKLQFAGYFEHESSKTGLAEAGPFGENVPGLHPSEIKLGFIGTLDTISSAKEWIEQCGSPIESSNIKTTGQPAPSDLSSLFPDAIAEPTQRSGLEKTLYPDFIGFNRNSPYKCCFQTNERWERVIPHRELQAILSIEDKALCIRQIISLSIRWLY